MLNSQIDLTVPAKKELDNVIEGYKKLLLNNVQPIKDAEGKDRVEVTASDIDRAVRLIQYGKTKRVLLRQTIAQIFAILGVLLMIGGLFYPQIEESIRNPIQAMVIAGGIYLGIAGFYLHAMSGSRYPESTNDGNKDILNTLRTLNQDFTSLTREAEANFDALPPTVSAFTYISLTLLNAGPQKKYNKVMVSAAERDVTRALEKSPTDSRLLAWLYSIQGVIFRLKDQIPEALASIEASLRYDAHNPQTLFNAACCASLTKDYNKSLEYLKRSLEIDPNISDLLDDNDLSNVRNEPTFPKQENF